MKTSDTSPTRERIRVTRDEFGKRYRAAAATVEAHAQRATIRLVTWFKALPRPRQIGLVALIVVLIGVVVPVAAVRIRANVDASNLQALAQSAYQEGVALHGEAAPSVRLPDQNGHMISLRQFQGHPVVVTFFDSVCPHADCSLMAQYLNWSTTHLTPAQVNTVNWVAISVDPWHDTPQTATAFLQSHQVKIPIHYLLGSLDQLTPIWNAFHMQAQEQSDGVVLHTTGVFVLDGKGQEQLYLDEGFNPAVLAGYLQYMLATNGTASGTSATTSASLGHSYTAAKTVGGDTLQFTATPGQYGSYDFTVTVEDNQGVPVNGATVNLTLHMTTMEMAPVTVNLSPTEIPGAYQAKGVLSMRGGWSAQAQVQLPGSAPLQATFNFDANY